MRRVPTTSEPEVLALGAPISDEQHATNSLVLDSDDKPLEKNSVAESESIPNDPRIAEHNLLDSRSRLTARLRIICVILLFVSIPVFSKVLGLHKHVHRDQVRLLMSRAGPFGVIVFACLFAIGELLHVPGVVFVAAAVFSYGPFVGGLLAYVGSMASVSAGFFASRHLGGGTTLEMLGLPNCLVGLLDRLIRRPILIVALLRFPCYLAPNFNMAMGLTSISFRSYCLGSALGLIPMTVLVTCLLDYLLAGST